MSDTGNEVSCGKRIVFKFITFANPNTFPRFMNEKIT